jgi:prepilin-type N-terminal cleavage/methylation domain-containing protein
MNFKKGFTLIELLVVIAIIGVLSSIVLSSLNNARSLSKDARRKMELKQVQTAIELYYSKCNTYVVKQNCTGTAYGSGGYGWLSYSGYSGSAGSVAQGLVDNDVMGTAVVDPSNQITSNGVRTGYMIAADANHYTVWANLENPSTDDMDTLNKCYFSSYDGYSSTYQASARINYCVSN